LPRSSLLRTRARSAASSARSYPDGANDLNSE
jgi:hypothetical protein